MYRILQMMKKDFTLEFYMHPLKNISVNTRDTKNTEIQK